MSILGEPKTKFSKNQLRSKVHPIEFLMTKKKNQLSLSVNKNRYLIDLTIKVVTWLTTITNI